MVSHGAANEITIELFKRMHPDLSLIHISPEENLAELGRAGLDELRFNLGTSGCSDRVIENMRIAKRHIPFVGVATPMTPELSLSLIHIRCV